MKKVTAVIGSPRADKSTTAMLTKNFLELVKENCPELEYEILMLDGSLAFCRGCMGCTKAGECIIKDGLQPIQQKLKESDMIILGSPVYVHGVSAQLKAFADRVFVWLHTLRLFGKPSISVITTAGSGISSTRKFLNMLLYLLGTIPIGCLTAVEYKDRNYFTPESCRRNYASLALRTAGILNGDIKLKPRFLNHFYFWAMKSKAKYGGQWLPYESKHWESSGWSKSSYGKVYKSL